MQKIDFVSNIEMIVEKLKSVDILNQFDSGFKQPGSPYNYGNINPLLFISKSNYDQIKNDKRYSEILTSLEAQDIYEETNLSLLTTTLKVTVAENILTTSNGVALYNFHNTLVKTSTLSKNILKSPSIQTV
jgi:hypothetical protein